MAIRLKTAKSKKIKALVLASSKRFLFLVSIVSRILDIKIVTTGYNAPTATEAKRPMKNRN